MPSGILLLDKPRGLTSNAALQRVRALLSRPKASHVGSLDPLATGMLPLCLGEATKIAGEILAARKRYRSTRSLAERTATGDAEGAVTASAPAPPVAPGPGPRCCRPTGRSRISPRCASKRTRRAGSSRGRASRRRFPKRPRGCACTTTAACSSVSERRTGARCDRAGFSTPGFEPQRPCTVTEGSSIRSAGPSSRWPVRCRSFWVYVWPNPTHSSAFTGMRVAVSETQSRRGAAASEAALATARAGVGATVAHAMSVRSRKAPVRRVLSIESYLIPMLEPARAPRKRFRLRGGLRGREELPLEIRGRKRTREEEPLRLLTASRAQPLELPGTLDPLGRHGDPQAVGQRQDGVGDGGVARGSVHVVHERLVDLDAVGRKAGDIGERGIAGAEVIERDPAAELAQPLERGAPGGGVLDQHRFGDLHLDQRRRNHGRRRLLGDDARRVAMQQVLARDVDGHRHGEAAV